MTTLRVPEQARPAWDRLTLALVDYAPPCSYDPELWWVTDAEAVEAAVYGCQRCRVVRACGDYANAAADRSRGVP